MTGIKVHNQARSEDTNQIAEQLEVGVGDLVPGQQLPATAGRVRDVVAKPLVDLGACQRGPIIFG